MLQRSVMARMFVMGLLLLVLMIPLAMTHGVIDERAGRRDEVAREISRTWGERQTLVGPVVSVPYRYVVREEDPGRVSREVTRTGHLVLLPEALAVSGRLDPEARMRGPFSTTVYTAHLVLRGRFGAPDVTPVTRPDATIAWGEATMNLGVSDPKGIASGLRVVWNGHDAPITPGVEETGLFTAGVQARAVPLAPGAAATFEISLDLRGALGIGVVPTGNETTVHLTSAWPHPGFSGGQLPVRHRVSDDGFDATWQSAWFARGFPAAYVLGDIDARTLTARAEAAAIGVDLVQPVDVYHQAERAVKYAVLFIVLTLAVAFVREITSGELVHPVQYLFVGFGLCLFYLLLVSLAEHIRFDVAYLVASTATMLLLAWYWSGVLRGWRQGLSMGVALTALYGYLYLLLRLEDLALVAGAAGLFVMLAIVMAMTRRVDWFGVRLVAPLQDSAQERR